MCIVFILGSLLMKVLKGLRTTGCKSSWGLNQYKFYVWFSLSLNLSFVN